MVYFDLNDKRYHLKHHNDNDSRTVRACEDVDFKVLLTFDSSLNVLSANGERCAKLGVEAGEWVLMDTGMYVIHRLEHRCNDYDWRQILQAEVAAAKFLLS